MTLFLIVGMPVFFIALLHLFFSGSFYGRELVAPLGIGALWFFPFCLLYALFANFVPLVYGGTAFYFSRTALDLAFPLLFCIITGLVTCRRQRGSCKEFFLHLTAFFTGFFMLFAQYVRIAFPEWYAEYMYFLLPLLWMALSVCAAFLVPLIYSVPGVLRFALVVILAALPFAMGVVPYLYAMNYGIASWILTGVFFAAALLLVWRVPPREN